MTLIVGILQPADDGLRSSDQLGKFFLRKPRVLTQLTDSSSDLGIDAFLLDRGYALRIGADVTTLKNLNRICSLRSSHGLTPDGCACRGSFQTSPSVLWPDQFRRRALSPP